MRLAAFLGAWSIARTIEDIRAGRTGRLIGTARFTDGAAGLDYAEEGALTFGDAPPVTASRRYLWCDAGPCSIEVRFADGRFFHRFDTGETAPGAAHECPPDHYGVRYDFAAWPRWRTEWRVRGPRKDYGMVTQYSPASPTKA